MNTGYVNLLLLFFQDGTGRTYIAQIKDELDKNHNELTDDCVGQGALYEIEGNYNFLLEIPVFNLNHILKFI